MLKPQGLWNMDLSQYKAMSVMREKHKGVCGSSEKEDIIHDQGDQSKVLPEL